jgi:hypothetical protein
VPRGEIADLEEKGGLPDSWIATQEYDRTRYDAAPENPAEFCQGDLEATVSHALDVGQRQWGSGRTNRARESGPRWNRPVDGFDE